MSAANRLKAGNSNAPFVTLNGLGSGVTDILFHYPNQVKTSASAPTVYPFTILANFPATKIARSTVTNAYNFLDIDNAPGSNGRVIAEDLFIGAFWPIGLSVLRQADPNGIPSRRATFRACRGRHNL